MNNFNDSSDSSDYITNNPKLRKRNRYREYRYSDWIFVLTCIKNLCLSLINEYGIQVQLTIDKGDQLANSKTQLSRLITVFYWDIPLQGTPDSGLGWRQIIFVAAD